MMLATSQAGSLIDFDLADISAVRGGLLNRVNIAQSIAGIILGTILMWFFNTYGWESPRTIWAAIVVILILMAVNFGEFRARIAKLESQNSERK